ncbi:MAG: hypothetical protein AB7F86_09685 [Bdellovibrionales bacterium]
MNSKFNSKLKYISDISPQKQARVLMFGLKHLLLNFVLGTDQTHANAKLVIELATDIKLAHLECEHDRELVERIRAANNEGVTEQAHA